MVEVNFDLSERKLHVNWTKEILDFTSKYCKENNMLEKKVKLKPVLKLINAYYDKDDETFKNGCREIAKELDTKGELELSQYVLAQIGDVPTFVPMDD